MVSKTKTVKRVVLTSSCAAMYADAIDTTKTPNKTLTEDVCWKISVVATRSAAVGFRNVF